MNHEIKDKHIHELEPIDLFAHVYHADPDVTVGECFALWDVLSIEHANRKLGDLERTEILGCQLAAARRREWPRYKAFTSFSDPVQTSVLSSVKRYLRGLVNGC